MQAEPPVAAEAPDWSATTERIACPLCDYDLRGLADPRCPECGYPFAWNDLTDPARRQHPFVFEHHPEANVWSFFKTLAGGWRPLEFWTTLRPSQPSKRRRLLIYAMIVTFVAALVPIGRITQEAIHIWLDHHAARSFITGTPRNVLDSDWPLPPSLLFFVRVVHRHGETLFSPLIAAAGWMWFTYFGLLVFQISMYRTKVDNVHVLRCVVYSADVFVGPSLLLAFVVALFEFERYTTRRRMDADTLVGLSLWLAAVAVLLFTHRLWRAYKHYLQFDHPYATVFCSQVIAFFMTLVAFNLNSATRGWIPIGY